MIDEVRKRLDAVLSSEAREWLEEARATLAEHGARRLPILWPQLARRMGHERLGGKRAADGDREVELGGWRCCDAVGLVLLSETEVDDAIWLDLYLHGDMEEKSILLAAMAFLPITDATVRLLAEVQRTNTAKHFEAAVLDSNLAVRALREGGDEVGFTREDFHRLVLKLAFMDLGATRMLGAFEEASPALSAMLQNYATEREAAGRSVWVDTARFIGRAPTKGTAARLVGGLEHGADEVRLAAAEGLLQLARPELAAYARERIEREPREAIRRILQQIAGG